MTNIVFKGKICFYAESRSSAWTELFLWGGTTSKKAGVEDGKAAQINNKKWNISQNSSMLSKAPTKPTQKSMPSSIIWNVRLMKIKCGSSPYLQAKDQSEM